VLRAGMDKLGIASRAELVRVSTQLAMAAMGHHHPDRE
jgi:hypothetical protein